MLHKLKFAKSQHAYKRQIVYLDILINKSIYLKIKSINIYFFCNIYSVL